LRLRIGIDNADRLEDLRDFFRAASAEAAIDGNELVVNLVGGLDHGWIGVSYMPISRRG
jgi:hypothetical protein